VKPRPIDQVAQDLGLRTSELVPYGATKAKISLTALKRLAHGPQGHYVLVTAINPTPLGEGKTTTAIGLAMGLCRRGQRAVVTLRQPSLGPVFGIKGGGAGGGKAQLVPMQDVNLHFTGDAHAVAASHNLLSACIDNHLFHHGSPELDPDQVLWPRAMGVSDRALRNVQIGGGDAGPARSSGFVITETSEVMAILALASDLSDLRQRLGRILIGFTRDRKPVIAEQVKVAGAMAVLLKDAVCPNLIQTLEGTPALVHTGPFGNIAHGNCSILADAIALKCADYVVTEAGFGSDLGAEKFFDIKCRASGFRPAAAVVVATLRALKLHGGGGTVKAGAPLPAGIVGPNREALSKGIANLDQHISNVRAFGVPVVVAINAFHNDPGDELRYVRDYALQAGAVGAAISRAWAEGGKGSEELAEAVMEACRQPATFTLLYPDGMPIKEKIDIIATRMYGAAGVSYGPEAEAQIDMASRLGYDRLPVCMAKTPFSLSHDPALKGRPTGFILPITELRILAGAGFVTAVCSGMQLMPGLPARPAGEHMDVDVQTGEITGLS
jgi:formyltetrahydrofolate synthetase